MLFFSFILVIIIIVTVIAIHTSRIGIEINNLIINTEKPKGQKVNKDSKIYVYLLIFKKIKLFKKDVKKMKQPKVRLENQNIDLDVKILKDRELKINYKDLLQNIDIDVKKINLNAQIGTQDAALTAILVGFLSAILGITLKKPKYQVYPIYLNKNILKVKIECIISIYLMHYIYKLISSKICNQVHNLYLKLIL